MPNVKLQSSDGHTYMVDTDTVGCSMTIKAILDQMGTEEEKIIPLPEVNSKILEKVIGWLNHHKGDPPQSEEDLRRQIRSDTINEWDAEFLNCELSTLFELTLAANHLDIKGLLEVCCKAIANMMKGKTPEEMRTLFNIKNDIPPDEEAKLREQNFWCKEKKI